MKISFIKPARLIYVDRPPSAVPPLDNNNFESVGKGPAADAEQVKKVISDAKNEVVQFVKENGLNFSKEYFDDMGAELDVDEIYNQLVESHQFGVEKDVGEVAEAFVNYVNTLRTYHQHFKAGNQFSVAMLNALKTPADALSKEEADLHDPLAGLGLVQNKTTGSWIERGPVSTLLAKRETAGDADLPSRQTTDEQTVARNEQPVVSAEEQEKSKKNNYVSRMAFRICDNAPLSAEEASNTIKYLADLGGNVEAYDLKYNAKMVIKNVNGRILVEYYPEIDQGQGITKRKYYARVESTGEEKTA